MNHIHPDDYADIAAEAAYVQREINRLRRRARLHPQDPDALDEDEQEYLKELEEWTP